MVLAFPCNQFKEQEPGSDLEIVDFCTYHYGVTFPIFSKIEVNGEHAEPLYQYLALQQPFEGFDLEHPLGKKLDEILTADDPDYRTKPGIKWNFTKFVIDRSGKMCIRDSHGGRPGRVLSVRAVSRHHVAGHLQQGSGVGAGRRNGNVCPAGPCGRRRLFRRTNAGRYGLRCVW